MEKALILVGQKSSEDVLAPAYWDGSLLCYGPGNGHLAMATGGHNGFEQRFPQDLVVIIIAKFAGIVCGRLD